MEINNWLIWSIEHKAWWRQNHQGYTPLRSEAGLYSFQAALAIVENANINKNDIPNEAMIKFVD
jgi:hypothetical protein